MIGFDFEQFQLTRWNFGRIRHTPLDVIPFLIPGFPFCRSMRTERSTDFVVNAPPRNVALESSWPPTKIASIAANVARLLCLTLPNR